VKVLVVIPARYASVRFPGKPLALIAGKPMVQRVWEQCSAAAGVQAVIVATEDERISAACQQFGGAVEITSAHHRSGTDRVAEVAARHPEFEIVLNVQGDEPAIEPATVGAVAGAFRDRAVEIASAVTPLTNEPELRSPHVVEAVLDQRGDALYFSRSPIPFDRGGDPGFAPGYWRHLGIYGFRRQTLLALTALPPSELERAESLEQLRWLQAGYRIRCVAVESASRGVDTPADLEAIAAGRYS
jgi:3-deoxy-manno-octulosonate cytidylyltransferase (CMP-KDO synthetase)